MQVRVCLMCGVESVLCAVMNELPSTETISFYEVILKCCWSRNAETISFYLHNCWGLEHMWSDGRPADGRADGTRMADGGRKADGGRRTADGGRMDGGRRADGQWTADRRRTTGGQIPIDAHPSTETTSFY